MTATDSYNRWMTPCEIGNWTLQPYRIFSIPQIQFTKGFPMLTMATFATCPLLQSLTVSETSLFHMHGDDLSHTTGPFTRVFTNKCPIRCYFHFSFVSPHGTMDFHFPKGISHLLSNWEDLACTNIVQHHWSPPGQSASGEASSPTARKGDFQSLGINHFSSRCQKSKEWSFWAVKGSQAIKQFEQSSDQLQVPL